MDDEDFLAAVEADNANTPVEEPNPEPAKAEEPATPEPVQPAPAEPALSEPATPTEPPVPTEAPKPEPIMVPLAALHETRDEVRTLKEQLARLTQQPQQQVQIPDRYEDPEGYEAFQEARIQMALQNQTLNTSERFARKEHGAETVEAAKEWAKAKFASDPLYQQQILRDPDPYEKVVADYRKEQLFTKIQDPSDFDAFLAWKQAQQGLQQQQAAPAAPSNQAPSIPPPSLAGAPSAGGINAQVIQTDAEIFDEVIGKR